MFIQIIQGKCSRPDELRTVLDRWTDELAPGAAGWLGGTYGLTDDGMFVGVVRFESREAAMANAARPEQGAWWSEAEQCFDGPVEFHDCEDVSLLFDGGSDQAGFVQVVRGKVEDPERFKALMGRDTDMLHQARPDIIGATLAMESDGTFTETIAFTDEESARRGEAQQQMPDDMRAEWDATVGDLQFMDLHRPWFASAR
jgi:hypothetical protein